MSNFDEIFKINFEKHQGKKKKFYYL